MTPASKYLLDHAIDRHLARELLRFHRGAFVFTYWREDGTCFERRRPLNGTRTFQPEGTPLTLYCPLGRASGCYVLLCEGEPDTLAAASILDKTTHPMLDGLCPVGLPGAATNPETVIEELATAPMVYLALDADEAGRRATERLTKALRAASITTVPVALPDGTDLADNLVAAADRERWLATCLLDAELIANEME